mmetsp:Transcript_46526/g.55954  ORF Transcript_46526/g.55954 Transcript_46526/m.55954 type:complete len:394 (+) Transcript_46526:154-1335(+)|eukprot:CAMPEP_0194399936 /NCGR_PEP_ID=MMETSP0174-20130528/126935_1 /TAXON_ID=216777 /ORGANISM="Proboscia alata, Strain PI-D3" /LENGTH=393 /DNA_ID=CAMNT_0039196397 /DNA_START=77 /DNA_END=1258 /DNA_ORIENTATION=-
MNTKRVAIRIALIALAILGAVSYLNNFLTIVVLLGALESTPMASSFRNTSLPPTNTTAVTIVVQLSGEMGNQLGKLSSGLGLQLWAKEKYGIDATLRLQHQNNGKWKRAMENTKTCFPNTRPFDFEECNTDEFNYLRTKQNKLFANETALLNMRCYTEGCIDASLSFFQKALQRRDLPDRNTNATIAIPYLLVDFFSNANSVILDRYYGNIKKLFAFDNACCKAVPEPDESVFHVRNFIAEQPKRGLRLGFEELSPNKTALELFSHLKAGDKIAITSRMNDKVGDYVKSLTARGLVVRVIKGQSPLEDFCFLLKAQKELVGPSKSTFAAWAGVLGDAEIVRLYSIDSTHTRKNMGDDFFSNYNYTNEKLRSRVSFELYRSEASDKEATMNKTA